MELSLHKGAYEAAADTWGRAIAAAAASTIAATIVRFAIVPELGPGTYFRLYLVAVAASAWLAGLRGGLVTTAFAAVAGTFFFLPPVGSLLPGDADSAIRLGLFGAEALLISALGGAMRSQWRRAEANGTFARGQVLALEGALEERRRAEQERTALLGRVGASERTYRLLAETVPQLVWAFGPDGRMSYCNARARVYLGLEPGASWSAGDLPELHPDDVELYRGRVTTGFASSTSFEVPVRLRRASDGAYRWHLVRFAVLRAWQAQPEVWVGAATDVHEQKRSEDAEHFLVRVGTELASSRERGRAAECVVREALGSLAAWCAVYEADEATGGWRVAAVAHVDKASEAATQAAAGRSLAERPWPAGTSSARSAARLVADVGTEVGGRDEADGAGQKALLRELGTTSWIHVPLETRGRIVGAVEFGLIGSRRYDGLDVRVAEQLGRSVALAIENERLFEVARREKLRAEEASRAKDQFLTTLSHELRTPLGVVLNWVQLLQRGEVPEGDAGRALEVIARNARSQAILIEDILDVARITAGKLELRPVLLDPAHLIETALESARPAAEAKQIRLETACEATGAILRADPERLQQVLWNLLSNAIKFTPKGGKVTVGLRHDGADLAIVVSDSGRGIDPSFLPFVFERFRQADGGSARAQGGLGLGLAIVKHIIELHGGAVSVTSEGVGRGTTLTVRLPSTESVTPAGTA